MNTRLSSIAVYSSSADRAKTHEALCVYVYEANRGSVQIAFDLTNDTPHAHYFAVEHSFKSSVSLLDALKNDNDDLVEFVVNID